MKTKDREQMVLDNFGLVGRIAGKYVSASNEYEDLFQVGCEGLMKAAELFDESRGFKFSTLAWPVIQNYIFRYLKKQKRHEGVSSIDIATGDSLNTCISDLIASDLDTENDVVENLQIKHYLSCEDLTEEERKFMGLRYRSNSQREVAEHAGVSQVSVSRKLISAKKKIVAMF